MGDLQRPSQATSLSLLERARTNDQDAWTRIATLYKPLVQFWCRRTNCPEADIDDVTQEVFAAIANGLSGFRRDRVGDTFRGWMRGITRNQVLLYFRRNQGRAQAVGGSEMLGRLRDLADLLPDEDEDEAAQVSQWYRRAVEHVRAEFEDRTWQMFWRTVIDERLTAAVAEEMKTTPASIRQAKSRVLRRLKEELGELLE
jgi:RNA polymerase sigma-70 factor (ECF subfamily)